MFPDWEGARYPEVALLERAMAHALSHARETKDGNSMVDGYVLAPFIEFVNHSFEPNSEYCADGPSYVLQNPAATLKPGDQITYSYG